MTELLAIAGLGALFAGALVLGHRAIDRHYDAIEARRAALRAQADRARRGGTQ